MVARATEAFQDGCARLLATCKNQDSKRKLSLQNPLGAIQNDFLFAGQISREFHERDFLQGVRWGDWKAVRSRRMESFELFDLSADLGEGVDVGQENSEILEKLRQIMEDAHTPSESWIPWTPK